MATSPQFAATYYPNLTKESREVQDAVKRAYDNIYQLRAQLASVVAAHNQLLQTVNNLTTAAGKTQTQIVLTNEL